MTTPGQPMNEEVVARPVRVSEGLFEALADRVDWGDPDDDGFYTPTIYAGKVAEALRLGLAWQACEKALPDGWRPISLNPLDQAYDKAGNDVVDPWIATVASPDFFNGETESDNEWEMGYGPTPADALDKLRKALDNR